MKHLFRVTVASLALAMCISPASATEAVMRNVSYDDCTVAPYLNLSFAKFFEGNANIFEGTVTATGPVPNNPNPGLNECWVNFHVDKWHKTSLATNEVNVLIHTDPTEEIWSKPNQIYCPVKDGEKFLIFGGDYSTDSGTGNTKFYLGECSLYLPIKEAGFFIGLLNSWNSKQK